MAKFAAQVTVALKPEILDPAGEATAHVLQQLGFRVEELRIGRHIRVVLEAENRETAEVMSRQMATDLLANPIMETFDLEVAEL